jgi:hypothetical protein
VPEAIEGSLMLASHALALVGAHAPGDPVQDHNGRALQTCCAAISRCWR